MFSLHTRLSQRRLRLLLFLAVLVAFVGTNSPAFAIPNHAPLDVQYASPADYPVPGPSSLATGSFRYFPQTTHFLRGVFFAYWQTHGATPVLGLPLTEPLNEDGLVVQYLERARLELHPEISDDPNNQVLLTRLGAVMTEARGLSFEPLPPSDDSPTSVFFPQTGHYLSNAFLSYWQRNGGLAVFGYPLSEELAEINPADGQQYTVQYFERNRFEWHPESQPNVQLGLLGVEFARLENLNPMSRLLLPGLADGSDDDLTQSSALADLVDPGLLPAVQALGQTPQFRWVPAVLIDNEIPVEFAEIDEEGVAGAFVITGNRSQPYVIYVPTSQRDSSVEALASVLAHETTHAYDFTTGVISPRVDCSIEEELRAYMNGLAAYVLLKGPDALTQDYPRGSLDRAVSNSLSRFIGGNTYLQFDFDASGARDFLSTLYGPNCDP